MRILGAIWLTQSLTILVCWSVMHELRIAPIMISGIIILGIGTLAAIWIQTTLTDRLKLNDAAHNERLARKSVEFRAKLSKQKAVEAERLAELARNTGNSRTGLLRVSIISGGVLGIVAALILVQFIGMAMLLVAFSGGGLAGYILSKKVRSPKIVNGSADRLRKFLPRLRYPKLAHQK